MRIKKKEWVQSAQLSHALSIQGSLFPPPWKLSFSSPILFSTELLQQPPSWSPRFHPCAQGSSVKVSQPESLSCLDPHMSPFHLQGRQSPHYLSDTSPPSQTSLPTTCSLLWPLPSWFLHIPQTAQASNCLRAMLFPLSGMS